MVTGRARAYQPGRWWVNDPDNLLAQLLPQQIATILKAANVEVEPFWPSLFAKALDGINIRDLITNVGSAAVSAPAAGGAAPAAGGAAAGK